MPFCMYFQSFRVCDGLTEVRGWIVVNETFEGVEVQQSYILLP